jgi:hypothetical protein
MMCSTVEVLHIRETFTINTNHKLVVKVNIYNLASFTNSVRISRDLVDYEIDRCSIEVS